MKTLVLFVVAIFSEVVQSQPINDSVVPLSIPASAYWDGDDGWWSTYYVRVGSPFQTTRLLPGTSASAGSTIWVVIEQGCTQANPTLPNCDNERGYIFDSNSSTSWSTERLPNDGLYSLLTTEESYLDLTGNAYYGFDTVNLGLSGSGMPTVDGMVIAGFATNDYWLGSLGISPIPFNFSDLNDPQPSLLSTLYNQSLIPSLSWAYAAGGHYQEPPVLGSLTLGGYDTTRFTPNDVTFSFGADFSRDLLVKLQSITYDTVGSSPLLAREIDIFIDSMVTQMWLPTSACQAFEKAFNLTWNATAELYILDQVTHNALLAENPTFTFSLANENDSTVDIVFPYAAFDLNVTQPLVDSETFYFPLKQAQNSSQYTLGRVFLQEAYVIADYNRQNFSVSQALFPQTNVAQEIVSIWPPGYEADVHDGKELSSGAIAGIVIAGVVVLALIIGICIWLRRRTKRQKSKNDEMLTYQAVQTGGEKDEQVVRYMPELDEGVMIRELESIKPELEANDCSSGRYELSAPVKVHEATGSHMQAVELEAPMR